jgi:hypothetical protein
MDGGGGHETVNRSVSEHVRRVRERLEAGRDEIARQRRAVDDTRDHIDEMSRWAQATERQLREHRGGRDDEDEAA